MNTRQTIALRTASLLAAAAVTAVLVGSQFGIADSYTQQADALLAAKTSGQQVAQRVAPVPRTRS